MEEEKEGRRWSSPEGPGIATAVEYMSRCVEKRLCHIRAELQVDGSEVDEQRRLHVSTKLGTICLGSTKYLMI